MFKHDMTPGLATELKEPMSKKKKTAARTAKLRSSKWYQDAARSIGIGKEKSREIDDGISRRDD